MFEEQYNDLSKAIDIIAERIRSLGEKAPGKFSIYNKLSNICEGEEDSTSNSMIKELAQDQSIIIETLTRTLKEAQHHEDEVTAGIITDRIEIHDKNAWMLTSSSE